MSIIALAGDSGAGKDTFAEVLVKNHGFKRIALADKLRYLCSKAFKMDYELFSEPHLKDKEIDRVTMDFHNIDTIRSIVQNEWGYDISYDQREQLEEFHGDEFNTPREILRCVGTRMLRNIISDNIWIELAIAGIREAGGKVIITDCRFENERETFRRFGALLVLIKREDKHDNHEHDLGSEDEYDVIFDNTGTLTEFQSNVNMWYTLRKDELEFYKVFKYE